MGKPIILDHDQEDWAQKYDVTYSRRGRENGAATYSRDIVRYHLPVWSMFTDESTLISTAPMLSKVKNLPPSDRAVQYLHSYVRRDPLGEIHRIADRVARPIVFVTAYQAMWTKLRAAGYEAIFVPMAVDTERVRAAAAGTSRYADNRTVYFGNINPSKQVEFERLAAAFAAAGRQLDVLSRNALNGRRIATQEEIWRELARYRFGVGVGRCALELHALGLQVLISGVAHGGLMLDEHDWRTQESSNFNGGVCTFDHDPAVCIEAFEHALVRPESNPISYALEHLHAGALGLRDRDWFTKER